LEFTLVPQRATLAPQRATLILNLCSERGGERAHAETRRRGEKENISKNLRALRALCGSARDFCCGKKGITRFKVKIIQLPLRPYPTKILVIGIDGCWIDIYRP
jgi:hypothetical protein